MGTATRRILLAAAPFLPRPASFAAQLGAARARRPGAAGYRAVQDHAVSCRPLSFRRLRVVGRGRRAAVVLFRGSPSARPQGFAVRALAARSASASPCHADGGLKPWPPSTPHQRFPTETEVEDAVGRAFAPAWLRGGLCVGTKHRSRGEPLQGLQAYRTDAGARPLCRGNPGRHREQEHSPRGLAAPRHLRPAIPTPARGADRAL